jgi:GNAT superfamily N-acetyltransferase
MKLKMKEVIVLSACNDSSVENIDFVANHFVKISLAEIKTILLNLIKKGLVEAANINGDEYYFVTDKAGFVKLNDDVKYFNEVARAKEVKIKRYTENDYIKVKKLIKEYYSEIGEPGNAKFYSKEKLNKMIVLYAEFKNKIIGFILGDEYGKNNFLLLDIFVKKEYRKIRTASLLMNALLLRIKGLYDKILSYPNEKSLGLLKKFNFKELPENEKNLPKNKNPPYFTYFLEKIQGY